MIKNKSLISMTSPITGTEYLINFDNDGLATSCYMALTSIYSLINNLTQSYPSYSRWIERKKART